MPATDYSGLAKGDDAQFQALRGVQAAGWSHQELQKLEPRPIRVPMPPVDSRSGGLWSRLKGFLGL